MPRVRAYRLWSEKEDKLLLLAFDYGMSIESIVSAHKRSCSAIIQRLGKLGRLYRINKRRAWVKRNERTYITYEQMAKIDAKFGFKGFRRESRSTPDPDF